MVGQISLFSFNFAPQNWLMCDGAILPISEFEPLFQLIGTKFGGDGANTFAVPNLKSAAPPNLHYCISSGGEYQPNTYNGYIGETMLAAVKPAATNLMPAAGQLLPKKQYLMLDTFMGTRFGGDAQNLALPNLQQQAPAELQYVIAVQGDAPQGLNPSARTPFVGEIRLLPYQDPYKSLMLCNGAKLAIAQNVALYSLIGTTFGGDGPNFALPDLTKAAPQGYSYYIYNGGILPPRS